MGLLPSRNRVVVPARQATQPGGIGSLESILGLLKSLKIRAQIIYFRPWMIQIQNDTEYGGCFLALAKDFILQDTVDVPF